MYIGSVWLLVAFFMVGDEVADHRVFDKYLTQQQCEAFAPQLIDVLNEPAVGQPFIDAGIEAVTVQCVKHTYAEQREA